MDPTLTRTIDMLRTAQDALESEMEVWALAKTLDEARLGHLRETARSLQEQAHSVLVTMLYQEVPVERVEEVGDLVGFFCGLAGQIEALLASSRRQR